MSNPAKSSLARDHARGRLVLIVRVRYDGPFFCLYRDQFRDEDLWKLAGRAAAAIVRWRR